ncbi:MAG: NUDIX domain-containing protein [Candidatus Babeliaceae bacterium]|jgi:mutator protein MutT
MTRYKLTPAVSVALIKDNKILLIRRNDQASFAPGLYHCPGGHVDADETIRQAAAREVFEEVGAIIDVDDLEFVHLLHRKGQTEEYLISFFIVRIWEQEPFNKEPHKHDMLDWCSIDNLPDTMIPAHRAALIDSFNGIVYSEYGW